MKSVQLTWRTWSDVCDFVPKENFISGTFLDNLKPVEYWTDTVGLELSINDKYIVVKESEWILKDDNDRLLILSDKAYKRNRILENI